MRSFILKLPFLPLLFLVAVSVALHWHVFPLDLIGEHNIRQAQTQQNIQNFYRYDFNILHPRQNIWVNGEPSPIFMHEFPIMQWLVALVYKVTGESFMVTRILMFLLGIVTIIGFYKLTSLVFKDRFIGMVGAWAFNFSPAFFYYTTCPFPDNMALCCAIWSLVLFLKYQQSNSISHLLCAAILFSISTAAKLPYIIFGAVPAYFVLSNLIINLKKRVSLSKIGLEIFIYLVLFAPTIVWYIMAVRSWGDDVMYGILRHPLALEEGVNIFIYHLTRMFPERLTNWGAVPFVIAGGYYFFKRKAWRHPMFPMLAALMAAVFGYWIFEYNMINTIHDYYMLPFLPLIFLVVSYGVKCILDIKHWSKWVLLAFLGTLPSFAFNYTKRDWTIERSWYNLDAFRYKEELRAAVPDSALCIILNEPTGCVYSYLINKRGLIVKEDNLDPNWLNGFIIKRKMHYMYSNSRAIDENPEFKPFLDTLLLQKGSIRVFKLKPKIEHPKTSGIDQ